MAEEKMMLQGAWGKEKSKSRHATGCFSPWPPRQDVIIVLCQDYHLHKQLNSAALQFNFVVGFLFPFCAYLCRLLLDNFSLCN
jgi:hypothetical protein